MYTGENKKAKESQKAFADAMVRLLEQKPYAEISVSALCRESGVSRQTFYTLFQNKENVLRYAILHNYSYPTEDAAPRTGSLADYMGHIFSRYLDANYDFLNLIVKSGLLYPFYECYLEWMEEGHGTFLRAAEPGMRRYLSISIAGTLCGIINAYMAEGVRRDPEELKVLVSRIFSGEYFRQDVTRIWR